MPDDLLTRLLSSTGQSAPLRLYALVDAAQGAEAWQILRAHALDSLPLLESHGPDLDPFSPHLLDLGEVNEQNEILRPGSVLLRDYPPASFTLLCSPLPLKRLRAHFGFFWNVQLSGGMEMALAFWDPAILGVLVGQADDDTLYVQGPVLNEEQKRDLLRPIANWQYRDREGNWHSIAGDDDPNISDDAHAQVSTQIATHSLTLTQAQEDLLVEASLPDQVLGHLEQDQPYLLDAKHPRARYYRFARIVLDSARMLGLTGMRDLVNFTALCLIYRQRVETDSRIVRLLDKVQKKELTLDQALELMPE